MSGCIPTPTRRHILGDTRIVLHSSDREWGLLDGCRRDRRLFTFRGDRACLPPIDG